MFYQLNKNTIINTDTIVRIDNDTTSPREYIIDFVNQKTCHISDKEFHALMDAIDEERDHIENPFSNIGPLTLRIDREGMCLKRPIARLSPDERIIP